MFLSFVVFLLALATVGWGQPWDQLPADGCEPTSPGQQGRPFDPVPQPGPGAHPGRGRQDEQHPGDPPPHPGPGSRLGTVHRPERAGNSECEGGAAARARPGVGNFGPGAKPQSGGKKAKHVLEGGWQPRPSAPRARAPGGDPACRPTPAATLSHAASLPAPPVPSRGPGPVSAVPSLMVILWASAPLPPSSPPGLCPRSPAHWGSLITLLTFLLFLLGTCPEPTDNCPKFYLPERGVLSVFLSLTPKTGSDIEALINTPSVSLRVGLVPWHPHPHPGASECFSATEEGGFSHRHPGGSVWAPVCTRAACSGVQPKNVFWLAARRSELNQTGCQHFKK